MAVTAEHAALLDRFDEELRLASAPTLDLLIRLKTTACTRLPALDKSAPAARLEQFIAGAAWTEAAIGLINLEIPGWKLRRVVCEDGDWHCSLSRQPNLPIELDDLAEASHEVLALAVLRAFVAARRRDALVRQAVSTVPQIRPTSAVLVCGCDNFA